MTICKWCRRTEAEHADFDHSMLRWCEAEEDEPLCNRAGDGFTFEADDSPTGKLIAAALEAGEHAATLEDPGEWDIPLDSWGACHPCVEALELAIRGYGREGADRDDE